MIAQYNSDKAKVFPDLREGFIKSCLFLINKSDMISEEKKKSDIRNNIFNNIKTTEKD